MCFFFKKIYVLFLLPEANAQNCKLQTGPLSRSRFFSESAHENQRSAIFWFHKSVRFGRRTDEGWMMPKVVLGGQSWTKLFATFDRVRSAAVSQSFKEDATEHMKHSVMVKNSKTQVMMEEAHSGRERNCASKLTRVKCAQITREPCSDQQWDSTWLNGDEKQYDVSNARSDAQLACETM